MRDAVGGVFIMQAIFIFMIIVNCFLAFSVNYTKAFRAKNEIRSIIEKNEGLTCSALCQIDDFLNENKYTLGEPYADWCRQNDYSVATNNNQTPLFCYKIDKVDAAGTSANKKAYKGAYYTIATFVNINIPIFDRVFEIAGGMFKVQGETALIYSSGENHSGLDERTCDCAALK